LRIEQALHLEVKQIRSYKFVLQKIARLFPIVALSPLIHSGRGRQRRQCGATNLGKWYGGRTNWMQLVRA